MCWAFCIPTIFMDKEDKSTFHLQFAHLFFLILIFVCIGYYFFNQYQSSQNVLIAAQQQKIDTTDQQLKAVQEEVSQAQQSNQSTVDDSTIAAEWQNRVAKVICTWNYSNGETYSGLQGSSLLINLSGYGLVAVTNKHVVTDSTTGSPLAPNTCTVGVYGVGARTTNLNSSLDVDTTPIHSLRDWDVAYISLDDTHASQQSDNSVFDKSAAAPLKICTDNEARVGDKLIVLGYPAIGTDRGITVTDGIVSGIESDYYVTSAKIDHGNSGGAAVLVKDDCYLGIPTWVENLGGFESLGRILKASYILGN